MSRRLGIVLTAAAAMVAAAGALPGGASAKPKKRRWNVGSVEKPLGIQGVSGAGANVQILFTLIGPRRRGTDVEVQYGTDRNADGTIADNEFSRATEDRLDPRDTRNNRKPLLFGAGAAPGVPNVFVWNSTADLPNARVLVKEYALTPQGRGILDGNGQFVLLTGPGGTPLLGGVQVRVRTVQRRGAVGDWAASGAFDLMNSVAPWMTIDSAAQETPGSSTVLVRWTAFDAASEDLDGNGVLDLAQGEDMNVNGVLDCVRVGVAFDFHRVAPGEDPSVLTDSGLDKLQWYRCSRLAGVGDTDSLLLAPGAPIPTTGDMAGVCAGAATAGRQWTFAWDAGRDVGVTTDGFILRARPFNEGRNIGPAAYRRTIVYPGQ